MLILLDINNKYKIIFKYIFIKSIFILYIVECILTEELMLLNCGVGEDSWESLALQGIQPVHTKGNQSWIFIGKTDDEAETPMLWPPDANNWLIWKGPDAGKDWRWEDEGTTKDEVVDSMDMSLSKFQELALDREAGVLQSMGLQRIRYDWVPEVNWTDPCLGFLTSRTF